MIEISRPTRQEQRFRSILLGTLLAASSAGWAAELHYAPIENLERIDVQTLNTAHKTIDMAAYVLTDWPVIQALTAAAYRGVVIRLYTDGGQAGQDNMAPDSPFGNCSRRRT